MVTRPRHWPDLAGYTLTPAARLAASYRAEIAALPRDRASWHRTAYWRALAQGRASDAAKAAEIVLGIVVTW